MRSLSAAGMGETSIAYNILCGNKWKAG